MYTSRGACSLHGAGHPSLSHASRGPQPRSTLLGCDRSPGRIRTSDKKRKASVAAPTITSGARVSHPLILVPAGPQLRAMREALGVTREQVAKVAGLTPDTVGEIERDRRPTAAARLLVSEVLCGMNPATRLAA